MSDIEAKALTILKLEKNQWEDAVAFITDRVFFQMRNLIRQLRKNHWGVFDQPVDPTTGRRKIWIPLTESIADAVVKNIDLDTKDINFRAKKPESFGLTNIVRSLVKNYLDEMGFGEYLDEFEKTLAIDGTAVWKTITVKDEDGKYCVKILPVDLLNIYIDPTSHSIAESYRFTERSLMTQQEVQSQSGWINTSGIEGTWGLPRTDSQYKQFQGTRGTKYIDVWEMWGKIPKSLISGNKSDENQEVEGHIIISGLDTPGKERVHLIEQNTDGKRPYEEAWYSRVPGRWYGRGVAEKLMMLQIWINTIINIRINRAYVQQLGLFKIRKGAGVTPQMLSKLPANGAVVLNNMDDLEQLTIQEASQASYNDENNIWDWSQKVTSAYDTALGKELPASTPATNAAISNQNSMSAFTLIKEQIGMFLQRWVKNQCLPAVFKNVSRNDILRITPDDIRDLDERIVYEEVFESLKEIHDAGRFFDPQQIDAEIERRLSKMSKMGNDRYVKILHDLDVVDYDTEVYVTNEEFDKSVMVTNLTTQLQTIPALQGSGIDTGSLATAILRQAWDLMGLDANQIKKAPQQQAQPQQMPGQQPTPPLGPGGNAPGSPETPTQVSMAAQSKTLEPVNR